MEKKEKNKKIVITAAIIIAMVLVVFIGYRLVYNYNLSYSEKLNQELKQKATIGVQNGDSENAISGTETAEGESAVQEQMNIAALQEENSDIYAWITVPGTGVDYPVLQSETDDYYLKHTVDNISGLPGAVYSNKNNLKDFSDLNTILYGHNMKNGTMFGSLHKFENKSFFDENQYVYIYTQDERIDYKIFAACVFDNSYLPDSYKFTFSQEVERFLQDVSASGDSRNLVREDVTIRPDDKILTLSTCISGEDDKRYLILAVKEDK